MQLWVAGVILLMILAGGLVLLLCGKNIHKGVKLIAACVLGILFITILGYIILTFLLLSALRSPI